MDDIFTILIYLIIIVSFFSSFFKKKNAPKPPAKNGRQPDIDQNWLPQPEPAGNTDDGKNILYEIENIFKQDYEAEKTSTGFEPNTSGKKHVTIKSQTAIEMAKQEHRTTDSEHKMETDWERQRKVLQVQKKQLDNETTARAARFEQMLSKKEGNYSVQFAAKRIRRRLMHSDSLGELLIIGEILAKPKSLRR